MEHDTIVTVAMEISHADHQDVVTAYLPVKGFCGGQSTGVGVDNKTVTRVAAEYREAKGRVYANICITCL